MCHHVGHAHNSIAKKAGPNSEFQRYMITTKDTKSTKESEDETLDAIFQLGVVEVDQ